MTRFADELIGSDGEWCAIGGRRAIIRAVHDNGEKVTVQFEDNETTAIVPYYSIELEGEEV